LKLANLRALPKLPWCCENLWVHFVIHYETITMTLGFRVVLLHRISKIECIIKVDIAFPSW